MDQVTPQTPKNLNKSPPFSDINLFETDLVLQECADREGARFAVDGLREFGAIAGKGENLARGVRANTNLPVLERDDAHPGVSNGIVAYDPAYHELMAISMGAGLHCSTWQQLVDGVAPKPGAHVARAATFFMAAQMEAGHCCPVTMTHAGVAVLQRQPEILEAWLPKILSRQYDPSFAPVANKLAVTFGMGMTEMQGGTDVRSNLSKAVPLEGGGPGKLYAVTGHKYFLSAPMSDAFLVLAQGPGGLSCFLMPRFLPDGTPNAIDFIKLKDKLGNRSNASSEVEFHDAQGWLVGREGRGIRTILGMVTLTRLDCAVSSAGLMRFALADAIHHCRHRAVFGKKLVEQPLMTRVLTHMALHSEAATMLAMRLARSYDGVQDEKEAAFRRLMTPVVKYWVCKTAPAFAYEAMECLGGIGYVEDASPLARLYREVPVNAIWEGSGNVMCLDVLRVLKRLPESVELVLGEFADAPGGERRVRAQLGRFKDLVSRPETLEGNGRVLTGLLADLAIATLMATHAPQNTADAYFSVRNDDTGGSLFGSMELAGDSAAILERALPA
ncbi:MAG: acyl-CoA dehydrogenase family protein [Pseudomonadota bacterium]